MIERLVILGAAGDLTGRYLMPALARLLEAGALPAAFTVLGISRDELSGAEFRERMAKALERHGGELAEAARRELLARLDYRRADVADAAQLAAALDLSQDRRPLLAYLALPPTVYAPAIRALAGAGLAEGSRLAIEKPFGEDLAAAQALNRLLAERYSEAQVFRIDHFLGMHTVQDILALRFGNRVFESQWNAQHVARVEIVWDETLTLEGRAGYYDAAGALLDMLQNHLLQLLCLTAMEAPIGLGERDLRDRKLDVLRAVRRLEGDAIRRHSRRARYAAGRIGSRAVPAYRDEPGVAAERGTETFAELTVHVDNWRWAGVPFLLRSGKALGRDRREVAIHFRPVPHLAFQGEAPPNILCIELEPDNVCLTVNINGPGERFNLRATALEKRMSPPLLPAYSRLLLDALRGDRTLSIGAEEAEEAWRIIEPVKRAWATGAVPLHEYPAGSDGPAP